MTAPYSICEDGDSFERSVVALAQNQLSFNLRCHWGAIKSDPWEQRKEEPASTRHLAQDWPPIRRPVDPCGQLRKARIWPIRGTTPAAIAMFPVRLAGSVARVASARLAAGHPPLIMHPPFGACLSDCFPAAEYTRWGIGGATGSVTVT